jgi:hypothetical protein
MDNKKKNSASNYYFLLAVAGIFLFIFLFAELVSNMNFRKNAIKTTATISKITSSSDGEDHTAYIQYWVNDRKYDAELSYYSSFLHEGKEIKIYYNPDNPSKIVDGSLLSDIWPLIFPLFFIWLGMALTINTNREERRHNYLLTNGRKIKATFVEIEIEKVLKDIHDSLIVVKKENPLPMLVFEYLDPSQNRHTLKIDYHADDLGELSLLIGKEADIYVDPNDFSSYYVDIDGFLEAAKAEKEVY